MAVFGTSDIKNLPRTVADGLIKDAQDLSTVAQLSGREPMKFGNIDYITFNDVPKAEFVAEGADKGHTTGSFDSVTATPKKAQVTMRFNEEVLWADEDHQLGVLSELSRAGGEALARALDLGLYHRINPLTGTEISEWTNYLTTTGRRVEATGNPETDLEDALGALLDPDTGKVVRPTGIALDPSYGFQIATARNADGVRLFPDVSLLQTPGNLMGLRSVAGDTVSGRPEVEDGVGIKAIVGDFQGGIRWGVQRDLPLEVIRFGDPDGQGDLKRKNQIALRLEIVYGWYVFDDRFAVIEDPEDP